MGLQIHLMKKCVELQKNWPQKKIVVVQRLYNQKMKLKLAKCKFQLTQIV